MLLTFPGELPLTAAPSGLCVLFQALLVGFYDPCYGKSKSLWIRYSFKGRVHLAEAGDLAPLKAPVRGTSASRLCDENAYGNDLTGCWMGLLWIKLAGTFGLLSHRPLDQLRGNV